MAVGCVGGGRVLNGWGGACTYWRVLLQLAGRARLHQFASSGGCTRCKCVNLICVFCAQDLLALVEMQRTLAELEGMASPHHHQERLSLVSHGLLASGSSGRGDGFGADVPLDPETASTTGPTAKRPRLHEVPPAIPPPGLAGVLQNGGTVQNSGTAAGAAVGSGTGSGTDAAAAGPDSSPSRGALSWSWPGNGTVVLQRYGYSAAVLRCLSPMAPSSAPSSAGAVRAAEARAEEDPFLVPSRPACIDLHMQWRDAGGSSALPSAKGVCGCVAGRGARGRVGRVFRLRFAGICVCAREGSGSIYCP